MFAGKALRCDCGYEVRASDDGGLVEGIRRHALHAHGVDIPAELALDLARGARQASGEHDEPEPGSGATGSEEQ